MKITASKDDSFLRELLSEEEIPSDYGGKGPSIQELNSNISPQNAKLLLTGLCLRTMVIVYSKQFAMHVINGVINV